MTYTYFILLCNASRASIYATDKKYPKDRLQPITELTHPESREKRADLVTDRSGHYQTDHDARGAYEDHIDPKEREADQFAKLLAEYLEENYHKQAFRRLVIITPPHFLGLLEQHFSKHVMQTISDIIQKDYTLYTEPKLREVLHNEKQLA